MDILSPWLCGPFPSFSLSFIIYFLRGTSYAFTPEYWAFRVLPLVSCSFHSSCSPWAILFIIFLVLTKSPTLCWIRSALDNDGHGLWTTEWVFFPILGFQRLPMFWGLLNIARCVIDGPELCVYKKLECSRETSNLMYFPWTLFPSSSPLPLASKYAFPPVFVSQC